MRLCTLGHGTLERADFIELVTNAEIRAIVDIRAFPGSRRHPHFAHDAMEIWLRGAGVAYHWEPRLGGRRHGDSDSPNTALTNASFRAYADHMAGPEFVAGLDATLERARHAPTTVMCSESVWWRCHRRLVADAATLLRKVEVVHVFHDGRTRLHAPMPQARIDGDHLVYGDPPLPGVD